MPANPCSKWFWNDWDNDVALHLCSLAAQGLWMRMLSIAARATPIGYVMVNGRSVDATDLAHVTGASEAEIRCLIDELEDRRVFSRDRHHRIYNRRMVRDARSHNSSVQNGKKGGNPLLLQAAENKRKNTEGLTDNIRPPFDPLTLSPSLPLEIPKGISCRSAFDSWWEGYPDKVGKGKARLAFAKALTKTSIDQLILGVERYKATKPIARSWCNPATWLNEERWTDAPALPSDETNKLNGHSMFDTGPTEPPPALEGFAVRPVRPH